MQRLSVLCHTRIGGQIYRNFPLEEWFSIERTR
jgi:hypothetical protein